MCIACELRALFAMEDLPPSTGTAAHVDPRDETSRFVCEAPEATPLAARPIPDERKP